MICSIGYFFGVLADTPVCDWLWVWRRNHLLNAMSFEQDLTSRRSRSARWDNRNGSFSRRRQWRRMMMMTVGRMLPRCWSDQNGLIARSINSIYICGKTGFPWQAVEIDIECLYICIGTWSMGVNKIKVGKESQQDKRDNPSKAWQ